MPFFIDNQLFLIVAWSYIINYRLFSLLLLILIFIIKYYLIRHFFKCDLLKIFKFFNLFGLNYCDLLFIFWFSVFLKGFSRIIWDNCIEYIQSYWLIFRKHHPCMTNIALLEIYFISCLLQLTSEPIVVSWRNKKIAFPTNQGDVEISYFLKVIFWWFFLSILF